MKSIIFKVGDMLECSGHTRAHLYSIIGVYPGALNTESLVQLEALYADQGSDGPKPQNPYVPYQMLEAGIDAGAFTHLPREYLDQPPANPARNPIA